MRVETKSYLSLLALAAVWDLLFTFPPILIHFGINADIIYKFFSPVCDQIDARSFHIFGYKLAVCSRCASIYYGFTFGLVIYPLFRSMKEVTIPNLLYIMVPLAALGADWAVDYTSLARNTFVTRSITGGVFGISIAFFVLPAIIELMREFSNQNNVGGSGTIVGIQDREITLKVAEESERSLRHER